MEQVRIVVIDSGIDTAVSDLSGYVIQKTGFYLGNNQRVAEDQGMRFTHPHGTVMALIIRHLCKNVEFISMNILNENLRSDGRVLIHAFKKAVEMKPDLIHLSLGTKKWRYKWALQRLVNLGARHQTITIAAVTNYGGKSYPAFLKNVIRVKMANLNSPDQYLYWKGAYYAPVDSFGIEGMEVLGEGVGGNSTAAAYITGHLARIRSKTGIKDRDTALQILKDRAGKFGTGYLPSKNSEIQ